MKKKNSYGLNRLLLLLQTISSLVIVLSCVVVCQLPLLAAAAADDEHNTNEGNNNNHAPPPRTTSFIPKSELESKSEQDWVSFQKDIEFLPATDESLEMTRRLGSSSNAYNPYDIQPFVEGASDYDAYQQAWRYLGFMIDCDESYGADDDGGGGSGSGDELTGEGCHRYVIWAAYVDLDYSGGGIGEYQYWDRWNQEWNTVPCNYAEDGSGDNSGSGDNDGDGNRCAKMDCHLDDTHWSLLGFFKHKSYDDWMEQLFKHEGYCIWTDNEYEFMNSARETWPSGCTLSGSTFSNGDPVYYDVKPLAGGSITLGLYKDTQCVSEYTPHAGGSITLEGVLGNILMEDGGSGSGSGDGSPYDADDYSLTEALALWESAFDIFKICQPCVAHDLQNYGYGNDDDSSRGDAYGKYTYGNDYDDDYSKYQYADQGANFDCYDQAGYTDVNQVCEIL